MKRDGPPPPQTADHPSTWWMRAGAEWFPPIGTTVLEDGELVRIHTAATGCAGARGRRGCTFGTDRRSSLRETDSRAARQDRPDVDPPCVLLASGVAIAAHPLLAPCRCARIGDGEGAVGQTIEQDVEFLGQGLRELVEDVFGDAGHLRCLALAHARTLDRATDSPSERFGWTGVHHCGDVFGFGRVGGVFAWDGEQR